MQYQDVPALGALLVIKGVTLVNGNSVMNTNLGLHHLVGACPPTDKPHLVLEDGSLECMVNQEISLFGQVFFSFAC